jgi:NAD(P)-dependent dehydrogenase (short-subunit alcohol dehydrogenase family)
MNGFPRFDLSGQTALVTGAARGLGRAISLALAHAGADVALGLRDVNTAHDLAQEIESMGRKVCRLQMEMSQWIRSFARVRMRARASAGSTFWLTMRESHPKILPKM